MQFVFFSFLFSTLSYFTRVRILMKTSPVPSVVAGPSRGTVNAGPGWTSWMFFPQCPPTLLRPQSLRIKSHRKADPPCMKEIVRRVCWLTSVNSLKLAPSIAVGVEGESKRRTIVPPWRMRPCQLRVLALWLACAHRHAQVAQEVRMRTTCPMACLHRPWRRLDSLRLMLKQEWELLEEV